MKEFEISYKNGSRGVISSHDKSSLIKEHFSSEEEFKEKVSSLYWRTAAMEYFENIETGETSATVATADANPYGWRREKWGE
ncbi:MAG: hypothetical protein WBA74_01335 [Cyclobacteriaceae bacterium]